MRRAGAILLICIAAMLLPVTAAQGATRLLPKDFFGIAPQTAVFGPDTEWMQAARIGTIRAPVSWAEVGEDLGSYDWRGLRGVVRAAAQAGIEVMPFLYGAPSRISAPTTLPVEGAAAQEWADFLTAAVRRFGPDGSFWADNPGLPEVPIRTWQIWNEPNLFYFTVPASPARYAKLLKISYPTIKAADPGARVVIGGLFGEPREKPPRAMPAAQFLNRLYRVRGIKRFFDGIGVHPYSKSPKRMARALARVRRVSIRNRDRGADLYVTEFGWGSQANSSVAFEVGPRGQARRLRSSYRYLIRNRRRLRLKTVFWFTWKDVNSGACSFCDSTGLFRAGNGFSPKPAWRAFVKVSKTRVRARPDRRSRRRSARGRRGG